MMRAVPVGMIAPGQPLAPFARPEEEPEQVRLPFFVVQEEKDGTLSAIGIGYYDLAPGESFDQVFLQELIQEVTRSGRPFGELEQYHLRFLRVDSPFGQRIVFAVCRAVNISFMLCPFTSTTRHPKERHLSPSGSTVMMSFTQPLIWTPLQSTIATRFFRLWWLAAMAASQTMPSCISPSPSMT